MVPGRGSVAREFLGYAAAEPQQAAGEDGADLLNVLRWLKDVCHFVTGHCICTGHATQSVLSLGGFGFRQDETVKLLHNVRA